jgi:hypothetical protein
MKKFVLLFIKKWNRKRYWERGRGGIFRGKKIERWVRIKRTSESGNIERWRKGEKNARLPFDLLKKNQANLAFLVFKFGSIFSCQFFAKSNGKYVIFLES